MIELTQNNKLILSYVNGDTLFIGNQPINEEFDYVNINAVQKELTSPKKYDTIIFSSALSQISSYDNDMPYSIKVIENILNMAYNKLTAHGRLLIYDGIKAVHKPICMEVRNLTKINDIQSYFKKAPMFLLQYIKVNGYKVYGDSSFLKEFLYKKDDINIKYGILTILQWKQCVKNCKFKLKYSCTNEDGYLRYLSKELVINKDIMDLFNQASIFIVAEK